jgi:hypothetical protein
MHRHNTLREREQPRRGEDQVPLGNLELLLKR